MSLTVTWLRQPTAVNDHVLPTKTHGISFAKNNSPIEVMLVFAVKYIYFAEICKVHFGVWVFWLRLKSGWVL
jgi:hypothetical protein